MERVDQGLIEWAAAALPIPGQTQSGDVYVVEPFPNGMLVGVVDGFGHGEQAALAANAARAVLARHAEDSVISLVDRCHERLRSTRGVVMSLASFNARESTITWIAIGNVAGFLLRREEGAVTTEPLLLRGGVVGDQLPRLNASIQRVTRGDVLVFATDGIQTGFADAVNLVDRPQRIADRILARYARGNDDALVLVARFTNGSDETHPG